MTARAALLAVAPTARRWAVRLAALFVLWALAAELATSAGFVAAVASPPGVLLLVAAGLAALVAAAAEPLSEAPLPRRAARALSLLGAGLLLLSPPLSLTLRETRSLRLGEGERLAPGALPGLPALRVGQLSLAPRGPFFPLSKTVVVPLEIDGGEPVRVGLFPPARLGGWRLAVFQFGYAPAIEWQDEAGRTIAAGWLMLGTFPRSEEEARLVDWLPEPNVMMGVGTFPPRMEDIVTPAGSRLHLHVRLQEAAIAGARRTLAAPDGYRYVMDGRPADPTLYLQVFDGTERRFEGMVRAGRSMSYPGGRLTVGPALRLWADVQAVRDPFVEIFLAGGAALAAGATLALLATAVALARGRKRPAPTPPAPPPPPARAP